MMPLLQSSALALLGFFALGGCGTEQESSEYSGLTDELIVTQETIDLVSQPNPGSSSHKPKNRLISIPHIRLQLTQTPGNAPLNNCISNVEASFTVKLDDLNSENNLSSILVSDVFMESCEGEYPPPGHRRFYELSRVGSKCGSIVYAGILERDQGISLIRVYDHTSNQCGRSPIVQVFETDSFGQSQLFTGSFANENVQTAF